MPPLWTPQVSCDNDNDNDNINGNINDNDNDNGNDNDNDNIDKFYISCETDILALIQEQRTFYFVFARSTLVALLK